MARLIVKSPYIKCGGGKSAGGYLKYIATRERVEIIPDDRPPTRKKEKLIAKLVKDFPDARELIEYEDYMACPTKANASTLISLVLESNWDEFSSIDGYAGYIALRPRAERLGEHGLFGDDDNVDLNRAWMNWIITPATCGHTSPPYTGRMRSGWGTTTRKHGARCCEHIAMTSPQR